MNLTLNSSIDSNTHNFLLSSIVSWHLLFPCRHLVCLANLTCTATLLLQLVTQTRTVQALTTDLDLNIWLIMGLSLGFRNVLAAYKSERRYASRHTFFCVLSHLITLSLLSDSNQRPRDYKSRALANWAKEAGWASCSYRTATTFCPCYVPVLGDSKGAGRRRLARVLHSYHHRKSGYKGTDFI